jgi:hypothetical protein
MVLRKMLMPGTPMVWGMQRRAYEQRLDIGDVPTAVATLQQNAKAPMLARGLQVRAEPDGRVRVKYPASRYNSPPYLRGQFVADERGGVVLQGTITEAGTTTILAWIFAFFAVLMLPIFVGLLVTLNFGNPGLYVCGVFGVLFALFAYLLLKMRAFTFRFEADHLEQGLRTLLPMGRSRRLP